LIVGSIAAIREAAVLVAFLHISVFSFGAGPVTSLLLC